MEKTETDSDSLFDSDDEKTINKSADLEIKGDNHLFEKNISKLPIENQIIYKILTTKQLKSNSFEETIINNYKMQDFIYETKYWPLDKLGEYLYFEKQEIINYFYNSFENYLEDKCDVQAENIFATIQCEISKTLQNQLEITKNTNEVIINKIKFVVDFDTLRISTFDNVKNKTCQTYAKNMFKYVEMMFWHLQSVHIVISANKTENGYVIRFTYSNGKCVTIELNEWVMYDEVDVIDVDENNEYTDDEAIEELPITRVIS